MYSEEPIEENLPPVKQASSVRLFSWLAALTIVVGFLGFSLLDVSYDVKEIGLVVFHGTASLLALGAIWLAVFRIGKHEKRVWIGLGLTVLFWVAGDVYSAYQIVMLKGSAARPTPGDLLYLIAYGFLMWTVVSVAASVGAFKTDRKGALKGAAMWTAMFLSASGLVWASMLGPLYGEQVHVGTAQKIFDSIYPILDIAVIAGLLVILSRRRIARWQTWLVLLLMGLVMTTVADISYNFFAVSETFKIDNPAAQVLYSVWLSGYCLYFMSAVYRLTGRSGSSERPQEN